MARARHIPGLDEGLTYREAAVRVVEVRAAELFDHSNGVLDTTDIERVHDMRVASRRLRAALEVFGPCFPAGKAKRTLKDVRALADALGARRDADVSIAALEGYGRAIPAVERPGVESMIETIRAQQGLANEGLAPAVDRASLEGLRARLQQLIEAAS